MRSRKRGEVIVSSTRRTRARTSSSASSRRGRHHRRQGQRGVPQRQAHPAQGACGPALPRCGGGSSAGAAQLQRLPGGARRHEVIASSRTALQHRAGDRQPIHIPPGHVLRHGRQTATTATTAASGHRARRQHQGQGDDHLVVIGDPDGVRWRRSSTWCTPRPTSRSRSSPSGGRRGYLEREGLQRLEPEEPEKIRAARR